MQGMGWPWGLGLELLGPLVNVLQSWGLDDIICKPEKKLLEFLNHIVATTGRQLGDRGLNRGGEGDRQGGRDK